MKRLVIVALLFTVALPGFASTHKEVFNVSCNELWRALKDTLRNSGKYGIIGIDNSEMTASYNIGGNLTGKRVNSVVLNSKDNGANCELQVQTAFSGLANNDAGDLKKRVDESLVKLKGQPLSEFRIPRPISPRHPLLPLKPHSPSIPIFLVRTSKSTAHSWATPPPLFPSHPATSRSPSRKRALPTGARPSTSPEARFT